MLRVLRGLAAAAALLAGASCVHRATIDSLPKEAVEDGGKAKFHLLDGRLFVAESWTLVGDEIRGTGAEYGVERDLVRSGPFRLRRFDVALVETAQSYPNPAIIPMVLATGASAALTIGCLAATKACFGSCPTFYVPDGKGGWTLEAEGFSSSIAKILEADDVDDMAEARPEGGAIIVAMRNEALETHAIRALSLYVVRGPEGSAVLRGFKEGGFVAVGPLSAPSSCEGPSGCVDDVSGRDGRELGFESDNVDLASRTSITLRYPAPGKREAALVLTARNSLMSTYVLYQMIAFHGSKAGEFIASVERGDGISLAGLYAFDKRLGGIEVEYRQGEGRWHSADALGYIGPIARATRAAALALDSPSDPVEVKLTFARAHYRIDAARIAPLLAGDLSPVEVLPEVLSAGARDRSIVAASLRGEGERLVNMPGDEVRLRFAIPAASAPGSEAYFIHSRGFYYEWMRSEWLADEDPEKARAYLLDPSRALRELAPSYRKIEPSMEAIFRGSRFWRPAGP
jgi:hypothetical protein